MPRLNTLPLVVPGAVPVQLQDLGYQVLDDSGHVDRTDGADKPAHPGGFHPPP